MTDDRRKRSPTTDRGRTTTDGGPRTKDSADRWRLTTDS